MRGEPAARPVSMDRIKNNPGDHPVAFLGEVGFGQETRRFRRWTLPCGEPCPQWTVHDRRTSVKVLTGKARDRLPRRRGQLTPMCWSCNKHGGPMEVRRSCTAARTEPCGTRRQTVYPWRNGGLRESCYRVGRTRWRTCTLFNVLVSEAGHPERGALLPSDVTWLWRSERYSTPRW